VFWLLAALSVAITAGVLGDLPLSDFLPSVITDAVPPVVLEPGLLGLYFAAGIAVSITPLHRVLHYSATVVHELGHAFVTGLLGGRPREIEIHPSGSGVANYEAPVLWSRWRRVTVTGAGYPAPAVAGLAGVMAAVNGLGALWVVFTASVLMLAVVMIIRNLWGFFWSAAVLVAAFLGGQHLSAEQVALLGVAMSGFLLTEALRDSWEQIKIVRRINNSGADAERIADWLSINRTFVAFSQFVMVGVLSALSVRLGLVENWSEVVDSGTDLWGELQALVGKR